MKKPNYWTYENCKEEALKYDNKTDFFKKSSGAYDAAYRKGWLGDICIHMIQKRKPNNYWTKERCFKAAMNCTTNKEFQKIYPRASELIYSNNWVTEAGSHFQKLGNRYNRCIYCYEFSDNYVYIGLTYDLKKRDLEHNTQNIKKISVVGKHINETGITPIFKQLSEYVDVYDAVFLENFYLKQYSSNNWNVLNIAKTGGIGGKIVKWTKEKCIREALKYKTRNEFELNSSGAYDAAHRNKWLNEISVHMLIYRKHRNYWSFERCKEEYLKYNKLSEFRKYSNSAYVTASHNKWINSFI